MPQWSTGDWYKERASFSTRSGPGRLARDRSLRDELTRDLIDITDLFDIVIGPQDPFHARDIGILN